MRWAALTFWISASVAAGNRLDFSYSFENKLDVSAADVLSGMVYVYINMDTQFISDMGRCAAGVMMDICPGSRSIASAYQDITTTGLRVYTINVQFHILTAAPADCQSLFRLTISQGSDVVARLFELQMARDSALDVIDVEQLQLRNEFSVHLNYPLMDLRSLTIPSTMAPLPTAVATQTLSDAQAVGRNITDELNANEDASLISLASCTLVGSACVCVSLKPTCSWGNIGTNGRCVDANQPRPQGWQVQNDDCVACPSSSCSSGGGSAECPVYFTPCSCATSEHSCAWNRNLSQCMGKVNNAGTPCDLCPRQTGCNPPVTNLFYPAESSFALDQINASFSKDVRLTGHGGVRLLCAGEALAKRVPDNGFRMIGGNLLYINLKFVPNFQQRECALQIDEGALMSSDNISFLGLPCTESCGNAPSYTFVFKDNLGPDIVRTIPTSGASAVKNRVVQVVFNEHLRYSPAGFVAYLKLESTGAVAAQIRQGPQVSLDKFTVSIDIAGTFDEGQAYSLEIPRTSLEDLNGNPLVRALDNNAFTFTFVYSEQKVALGEQGLSPLLIGLIVAGVVLVICGICCVFRHWSKHMAPVRTFVGRGLSRMSTRARMSRVSSFGKETRQSTFHFRISGAFNLSRGNTILEIDKPKKTEAWGEKKDPKTVKPWDMSPKQLEHEIRKQRHQRKNEEKREARKEEEKVAAEIQARQAAREAERRAKKPSGQPQVLMNTNTESDPVESIEPPPS